MTPNHLTTDKLTATAITGKGLCCDGAATMRGVGRACQSDVMKKKRQGLNGRGDSAVAVLDDAQRTKKKPQKKVPSWPA